MQAMVREAYYDDPLIESCKRYHNSLEWVGVQDVLKGRSGTALDVGAGFGIASYALARDGFSVIALEPDPSELVGAGAIRVLAKDYSLPITVAEGVSESLPLRDASVDVVFARAVLHHTRNLKGALREFARVLKPGGIFVAIREHVISRPEDLPLFLAAHPLHRLYGGENAFPVATYVSAITDSGLKLDKIIKPLEHVVNYAPRDRDGINIEIADRLGRRLGLTRPITVVLGLPFVGDMLIRAAGYFDHRPGRHYSFVAHKT
jgi:SAM-dependent methyltransferase